MSTADDRMRNFRTRGDPPVVAFPPASSSADHPREVVRFSVALPWVRETQFGRGIWGRATRFDQNSNTNPPIHHAATESWRPPPGRPKMTPKTHIHEPPRTDHVRGERSHRENPHKNNPTTPTPPPPSVRHQTARKNTSPRLEQTPATPPPPPTSSFFLLLRSAL